MLKPITIQNIENQHVLCVIISHTLVHIRILKTVASKMTNKVILQHLGIISEMDNSECIDDCDC